MSWVLYAILGAVLTSLAAITQKKTLLREHAMEFSAVLAIFAAGISAPLLLTIDYSTLTLQFFLFCFINSIIGSLAFLCVIKAVRHIPITESTPLLSFSPAFTAIMAFVFLREGLSYPQIAGLTLLILGIYILEARTEGGFWGPFKHLAKSKYARLIFFALFLYSFTATIDKKLLGNVADGGLGFAVTTYLPVIEIMVAINFIIMISLFHGGIKDIKSGMKHAGSWIFLIALFTVGYRLAQGHALTFEGSKVALVSVIKRSSGLLTTILGGHLFHEDNLLQKSIACFIMVAGAILLLS